MVQINYSCRTNTGKLYILSPEQREPKLNRWNSLLADEIDDVTFGLTNKFVYFGADGENLLSSLETTRISPKDPTAIYIFATATSPGNPLDESEAGGENLLGTLDETSKHVIREVALELGQQQCMWDQAGFIVQLVAAPPQEYKEILKRRFKISNVRLIKTTEENQTFSFLVTISKLDFFTMAAANITTSTGPEIWTNPALAKQLTGGESTGVSVTPSTTNVSYAGSFGNSILQMIVGDMDVYTSIAADVFRVLDERIKFYEITFDKPFDSMYYSRLMRNIPARLKSILQDNNKLDWLTNGGKYEFYFSNDFSSLEEIMLIPAELAAATPGQSDTKANQEKLTFDKEVFKDKTTNFLIFSLVGLYNNYNVSWELNSSMGNMFLGEEQIREFINRYIKPAPSLVTSQITRTVIEKFILGDVRLLDDQYYQAYKVSPEQFPFAYKQTLNREISQQYQAIGDLMGEKFIRQEFTEINSVEEIYGLVWDHISQMDLIRLSAKCLLKILPAEALMDKMCNWVLEEFDDHKEKIITKLAEMDAGPAKDLALELQQIYFETIEDYSNTAGQMMIGLVSEQYKRLIKGQFDWTDDQEVISTQQDIQKSADTLLSLLVEGENSYEARKFRLFKRLEELHKNRLELESTLEVFVDQTIPSNHATTRDYYNNQIGKLTNDIAQLNQVSENAIQQLRIYNLLQRLAPPSQSRLKAVTGLMAEANKIDSTVISTPVTIRNPYQILEKDNETSYFTTILKDFDTLNPYGKSVYEKTDQEAAISQLEHFSNDLLPTWISSFSLLTALPSELQEEINNLNFTFVQTYTDLPDNDNSKFANFENNAIKLNIFFRTLEALQQMDSSPFAMQEKLATGGAATIEEYFTLLMEDETKRYYLCLAIYGAIPAIGYLIYQLVEHSDEVGDFFANQGKAIYNGFSKRIEMVSRTDYPVNDILKTLGAGLLQLGANFARDLLVTGAMTILNQIAVMCGEDGDKINAPYDPFGGVDLASLVSKSGNSNMQTVGTALSNSKPYKKIAEVAPDITVGDYKRILDELSSSFTINELYMLVESKASDKLYNKAIAILDSISSIKGTVFHSLYVNQIGIRNFFNILKAAIHPAYFANAIAIFEEEKSLLLQICTSRDDTILQNFICKDKTPEECLKLLSARTAVTNDQFKGIFDQMQNIFGSNVLPDPCAQGISLFDDSQKHSAEKIGNSIFGGIESTFETEISRVKDIYQSDSSQAAYSNPNVRSAVFHAMNPPEDGGLSGEQEALKKKFKNTKKGQSRIIDFVARSRENE